MAGNAGLKWDLAGATSRGHEAHRLVVRFSTEIEKRLSPGLAERLGVNLGRLDGTPSVRRAKVTEQKGKTGAERETAADLLDWVMRVRDLAKRTRGVSEGTLRSLGVGEQVSAAVTDSVRAAAQAVLTVLEANEGLVQQLGMLPEDLEEGRTLVDALHAADAAQKATVGEGKEKTFDKNVVQAEVEAAVDEIASRGAMAFRKDPQVRALFEALVSSTGPKPKAGEEPAPTT